MWISREEYRKLLNNATLKYDTIKEIREAEEESRETICDQWATEVDIFNVHRAGLERKHKEATKALVEAHKGNRRLFGETEKLQKKLDNTEKRRDYYKGQASKFAIKCEELEKKEKSKTERWIKVRKMTDEGEVLIGLIDGDYFRE